MFYLCKKWKRRRLCTSDFTMAVHVGPTGIAVFTLAMFFICIMMYTSSNFSTNYSPTETVLQKTIYELRKTIKELKQSSRKNCDNDQSHRSYEIDAEEKTDLEYLRRNGDAPSTPSKVYMDRSRRLEATLFDTWDFLYSQLQKLGKKHNILPSINDLMKDIGHRHWTMVSDYYASRDNDGYTNWRETERRKLSQLVRARLEYLQNPEDCKKAKKLVCNLTKDCGFGCQAHHLVYCLITAYMTERTLVLNSHGWSYAASGWESVFKPLSRTCRDDSGASNGSWDIPPETRASTQVIHLPIVDYVKDVPAFLPMYIPEDLAPRVERSHGNPALWWIAQIIDYLLRPNERMKKYIKDAKQKLGYSNPIVGIQVRRTDKLIKEAKSHAIEEYMKHVEDAFRIIETRQNRKIEPRKVFIATDDPSVLTEARQKYPSFQFISDKDATLSASVDNRYTDASLRGIVTDIQLLAESDFIVCTFSSQVCRVAFELMQTLHPDASQWYRTLDDVFYYGGGSPTYQQTLYENKYRYDGDLAMKPGDTIINTVVYWNGFRIGKNNRTGSFGAYPSYKAKWATLTAKFPTYQQATMQGQRGQR